jgi:Saxitoxin biosynthesis operon protein SxtJ
VKVPAHRLHEDLARDEPVEGPTDRGVGVVFAVFFAVVATLSLSKGGAAWIWWLAGSALFLAAALLRPRLLAPLNRLWLKLGLLLYKVVSPLTLGLLFFTTITPIGLLLRLGNKDLLRKRIDKSANTYWIPRQPPGPAAETMKNQF